MLHPREENVIALNTSINSWEKFFFTQACVMKKKLNNVKDGEIHGILKEKRSLLCVDSTEQELPPP